MDAVVVPTDPEEDARGAEKYPPFPIRGASSRATDVLDGISRCFNRMMQRGLLDWGTSLTNFNESSHCQIQSLSFLQFNNSS